MKRGTVVAIAAGAAALLFFLLRRKAVAAPVFSSVTTTGGGPKAPLGIMYAPGTKDYYGDEWPGPGWVLAENAVGRLAWKRQ